MCLDVLHPSGWTPATKVESLLRTIRSDLGNMGLSVDWIKADGTMNFNSPTKARNSASWIAGVHRDWAQRRGEPHRPAGPAKRQRQ